MSQTPMPSASNPSSSEEPAATVEATVVPTQGSSSSPSETPSPSSDTSNSASETQTPSPEASESVQYTPEYKVREGGELTLVRVDK